MTTETHAPTATDAEPVIALPLQDIRQQEVGGKAHGLKQLLDWQLSVPSGFVIINAVIGRYPADLQQQYQQIGSGPVAVRSSALGEDGNESSFAGQYETLLNVEGITALQQAIDQCLQSLHNERANAYQTQQQHNQAGKMCVVVQKMVAADSAGVLFSADPVSTRRDRLIIDAVNGLGEALVSGEATPDHYEFDSRNQLVYQELVTDKPILSANQQQTLISQARRAVQAAGCELDMEWAIDSAGQLQWLQARPITTLPADLNELDTAVKPDDVLTRCNIGEMMPGACCPLTLSITGRGIEQGMQHMHYSYANRPAITPEWTQVAFAYGKMFINLTGSAAAAATVLGVDEKSLARSVCGRLLDELKAPVPIGPWWSRLWTQSWMRLGGAYRLYRYIVAADAVIEQFEYTIANRHIVGNNRQQLMQAIDDFRPILDLAYQVHLQSSTTSGFANNVLQAIISGGQDSSAEEEALAAKLMAGATGVESAILVEQLDQLVDAIATSDGAAKVFCQSSATEAQRWLQQQAPTAIQKQYTNFLQRHGHRGYRELCLREAAWVDDPQPLIAILQSSVLAVQQGLKKKTAPATVDHTSLPRAQQWILPKAHNAIRRREKTKSLLVDITHRMKRAYRQLADLLVTEGLFDDTDQVNFFTHEELYQFVNNPTAEQVQHANQRRVSLAYQDRLNFDDVCIGPPQPIDLRQSESPHSSNSLQGRPVSPGIVEGSARVAHSVADARDLQAGEILVAPITDVGWTPYFSMIAGLVTDVGSSVSHGAVIAREYGLPAVVNTRIGTDKIRTGDHIRVDAERGIVEILNKHTND